MSSDRNMSPVAPWGYEFFPTQADVEGIWTNQLFISMVLGGYIWDIIVSFPLDCRFIFRRRFNYVTVIFVVNRLSMLAAAIGFWLFAVSKPANCHGLFIQGSVAEALTMLTSQALLLIRVWVLFQGNRFLMTFMLVFMLASPVTSITFSLLVHTLSLTGRRGCSFESAPSQSWLPYLMQALFDLLCFSLCTYKLIWDHRLSIRHLAQRDSLMKITRELLKGGFAYYLPNVIIQIVTVVFTLRLGNELQFTTTAAADGIASAQALRITRNLWNSSQRQETSGSGFITDSTMNTIVVDDEK